MNDSTDDYYYVHDHLFSPAALTDSVERLSNATLSQKTRTVSGVTNQQFFV